MARNGVTTYKQPISRTMEHNVNIIVNDNKTQGDATPITPNNTSASANAFWDKAPVTQSTGQVEESEDAVFYEDIDKKQSTGLKVTWRPWTSIYDVELFFHGRNRADDSEFTLEPDECSKIVIEQDFIGTVADQISVVVHLSPAETLLLLDNYRNLKAHLYVRRMNRDDEYIDKENPVIDQDFMVIFKDKELRKRISKKALIPNDETEYNDEHHNQSFDDIEIQLITEKEYELKNKRFHFILTKATVKDAICHAIKELGIEKISMPDPDNKTEYTNLIIPPQQSFKSFIDFLQDRYGVYEEGCNFYYNDEIMFIYPVFKRTVTDCPETSHFYCTGDGSYPGMKFYHAKDQNNMYHIVINRTPVIKELIDSGAENYGNAYKIQHADKMIDLHSVIGEGDGPAKARMGLGEINVEKTNTTFFSWDVDKEDDETPVNYGIINNPRITEFISTGNMLKYKSRLKSYRGTLCGFQWNTAEPYFLRPGYAVKWHIDGERDNYEPDEDEVRDTMEYKTYDGIARHVTYTLCPAKSKVAHRFPYTFVADILLDLDYLPAKKMSDPAETITNEDTDVSLQTDNSYAIAEKYDASATPGNETTSKKSESYKQNSSKENERKRQSKEANNKPSTIYKVKEWKNVEKNSIFVKWSDGSISRYDISSEIPNYKPAETSGMKSMFDLL